MPSATQSKTKTIRVQSTLKTKLDECKPYDTLSYGEFIEELLKQSEYGPEPQAEGGQ